MEIPLLKDILVLFGLAIAVLLLCHRLHVPTIVGFLLTGILAGPHGLGLISAVQEVEILAEIGIVLLLFTIGIEFSLENLLQIRRSVLIGGSFQVLLTITATYFISRQLGLGFEQSVFIGFLISLSSTAIVLKLLQEKAEVDSPHGRTTLGILIFQDVIIVPMILITPLLAGATGNIGETLFIFLAKGIGIILLVMMGAKWIVPYLLFQIARTRNRELFLLSVVVICFVVAWMTSIAGLSLALGAFLAGLIISESEYSHQALGNILPFRDIFTSLFFVSAGMLLDVAFLYHQLGFIVLITLCVLVIKSFISGFVTIFLRVPLRAGILVGLSLCQVGEFSFILSRAGIEHGLLSKNIYQIFLSISVLTMAATPYIIALAPRVAALALRLPLPVRLKSGLYPGIEASDKSSKDHLIIIGFGVNGRNVSRAASIAGIPYTIIEMNPETVRSEQAKGEPIHYGDATQENVLQSANIKDARVVVIAINDPAATRRITEVNRRLNPKAHLIVRTRYLKEMKPLYELGATEIIPEEFETSMEIFTRVLAKYLIPREDIERLLTEMRADGYEMFRSISKASASLSDLKLYLHDVEISAFRVAQGSPLIRKTLSQIDLRRRYGVSVVAVRRNSQILSNPDADIPLHSNDVLFVLGSSEKISDAINTFSSPNKGKEIL